MRKNILSAIFFTLIICRLSAQEMGELGVQQISPITPNAAALGKFGNIPVSLYTGIPNIQIPIYTIKVKNFQLPISLNYHSSGIKVDDVPSWVGMGWTLNAGGLITRQQRGIPDKMMIDKKDDFLDYVQIILDEESTQIEAYETAQILGLGLYDTEPDIFSINTGSLNQKFFLDPDGNAYCLPARKLKIVPEGKMVLNDPNGNYYFFDRWSITDEKGIQYIFGKTLDGDKTEIEVTETNAVCGTSTNSERVSSWYLNEIILPTGESITFKYDYFSFCIENTNSETFVFEQLYRFTDKSITSYKKALRLSEINYPSGRMKFIVGDDRRDISGGKVLDRIEIYSFNNEEYSLKKSFILKTNNPDGNTTSGDESFRLALLSLTEIGEDGERLPPYIFEYKNQHISSYDFGLPPRGSYEQDIYGYSNGAEDNQYLLPNVVIRDVAGGILRYISGSDRSINPEEAKAGILEKITYPTGGSSSFIFEGNIARGVVDESNPDAVNPLTYLANMDVLTMQSRTNNLQLENTNGSDVGYSNPFQIIHEAGVDVEVDAHIMHVDYDNPCTVTTPGGTGSFFECMDISLEREDSEGNFKTCINTIYFDHIYNLVQGTYRVKLKWKDTGQIGSWGYVDLTWKDWYAPALNINEQTELPVGGLRISKIVDYDPVADIESIRNFDYEFDEDDLQLRGTSGTIMYPPYHSYIKSATYNEVDCSDCYHVTSFNNSSLLQTTGGYVGYKKVTVKLGENGEDGKTEHYFLSAEDHLDENISYDIHWPLQLSTNYDWKRGLSERIDISRMPENIYSTVKSTTRVYEFNNSSSNINFRNFACIQIVPWPMETGTYYAYRTYNIVSESFYNSVSTIVEKTSQGDITTTTTYSQDENTLQVKSLTSTKSNGEKMVTEYKYPTDISFDDLDDGSGQEEFDCDGHCDSLYWIHFLASETCSEACSGDLTCKENCVGDITNEVNRQCGDCIEDSIFYKTICKAYCQQAHSSEEEEVDEAKDSDVIKEMIEKNMISTPIQVLEKRNNNVVGGNITKYKKQGTDIIVPAISYSIETTEPLASVEAPYIDSDGTLVIDESFKDKVHFDSYDEYGNITQVHKTGDISTTYLWGYNNTLPVAKIVGLSYSEVSKKVSPNDIQGLTGEELTNKLAPLRDLNAMVTIYTYDPLIGMTSMTDENGLTTHYEYDDFGRLKCTRDDDGNIINTYKYHYAGEGE